MSSLRRTLLQAARRPAPAACKAASPVASSRLQSTQAQSDDSQIADAIATDAESASTNTIDTPADAKNRPRWSYTPERMKAPFALYQPKDPRRSTWTVNEDPVRLDRMYERLLGRELARTLPDELKWLAVTHKSFDNGRRGFNTRLAYFGRMIVVMETSKLIMATPNGGSAPQSTQNTDHYGRTPFSHPALEMVDRLDARQPSEIAEPKRMAVLAKDVGLSSVMRWKPRLPENLAGSGIDTVAATTLYAIVGAVSLQYGGAVAGQVVRERLLKKLIQQQ
ncbi:rnase iii domain-containing protein [Ophiostoma piceae UAMH 11346]|uniref:Rnase iii domain-containing protein n=1 Tax=Ophiostoma piceae (strain UAMH 11346) TaxID=1262450 RepID=S3BTW8_OPHP1|nr:rnase iii domain-containing protein [Ophiostoma piceae UAMH 11346]